MRWVSVRCFQTLALGLPSKAVCCFGTSTCMACVRIVQARIASHGPDLVGRFITISVPPVCEFSDQVKLVETWLLHWTGKTVELLACLAANPFPADRRKIEEVNFLCVCLCKIQPFEQMHRFVHLPSCYFDLSVDLGRHSPGPCIISHLQYVCDMM